ncbi:MAG: hypothetical protein LC772_02075 [Chloroflexi bacterium]|nr:hypothetical protein [Chloroflexota bacterium]
MVDTLTSEQITYGSGPQLSAAQRDALANFMTDLHFRHVERRRPALVNRTNWTAWVRLEDFPAALLDLWPDSPARLLGKLIARIYVAYHARVSRGYLHRLALRLDSGQAPGNAEPDPDNLHNQA